MRGSGVSPAAMSTATAGLKSLRAMSSPSSSSMMPPAMRKAGSEMPKNFNSVSPLKKNSSRKPSANSET